MDVCQISQRNIMPRAVQKEGAVRFVMEGTLLSEMVLSQKKKR